MADPEAIRRALANLIDNAAEAMQGSLLRVLGVRTALSEDGEAVEVAVSDTGMALTDEIRERLFLPFYSTKHRGTGWGFPLPPRSRRNTGEQSRRIQQPQGSALYPARAAHGAGSAGRASERRLGICRACEGSAFMNHVLVVDDEAEIRSSD